MTKPSRLVWLDLETTGLKPAEGLILEYGIVITDLNLNEIARKNWVMPWKRSTLLENLNSDYVLDMHMGNGLFEESYKAFNALTDWNQEKGGAKIQASIQQDVIRWIVSHTYNEDSVRTLLYLAGSSVHFDRLWTGVKNEELLEKVSHRMLDVSSYLVGFPEIFGKPADGEVKHRALADLDFSISQQKKMREIVAAGMAALNRSKDAGSRLVSSQMEGGAEIYNYEALPAEKAEAIQPD